jgi:TRAP-type C4-dicarboxylate transport system substrate-binding protein
MTMRAPAWWRRLCFPGRVGADRRPGLRPSWARSLPPDAGTAARPAPASGRRASGAGIALLALGLLTAPMLAAAPAAARDLRIGLVTPPPHVWTQVARRIAANLSAAQPDIRPLVFPASQLGNEPEMFQQMQLGLLDMGIFTVAVTSLREPSLAGWFTPYLFADVAAAAEGARTDAARTMLANLDAAGLVGLGYTFAGMRHVLMRNRAITALADVAGAKIRITPFPAMQVWWEATPAAPTPVHLSAVYQSLQTGVLDGVDIDLDALVGLRLQQVATHLTLTNHMAFPAVVVFSKAVWAELSETERKAIQAAVDEALAWGTETQIAAEQKNLAQMRQEIRVTDLPDAETVFAPANAAFAGTFGAVPLIRQFVEEVRAHAGGEGS